MTNVRRKNWENEDSEALIRAWDEIGSITILAILLNRSSSSVQTQASRLGLPRRKDGLQKHRKRWSRSEERLLDKSIDKHTDEMGQVHIYQIAHEMNRSVDAIANKLMEKFGDEELLAEILLIPQEIKDKLKNPKNSGADRSYAKPGEVKDTRAKPKMRDCMTCRSPFWSEGAHNRICDKCKRACEGDESMGEW
jgi:hypothetical protein